MKFAPFQTKSILWRTPKIWFTRRIWYQAGCRSWEGGRECENVYQQSFIFTDRCTANEHAEGAWVVVSEWFIAGSTSYTTISNKNCFKSHLIEILSGVGGKYLRTARNITARIVTTCFWVLNICIVKMKARRYSFTVFRVYRNISKSRFAPFPNEIIFPPILTVLQESTLRTYYKKHTNNPWPNVFWSV